MKQLILSLTFVFIINATKAQTYTPMISNKKAWCLEWVAGLGYAGFKFQHYYDTIVNGKNFQVFSGTSGKNFFFEDIQNKKVYRYNTINATTELLYDFNLTLGDTLTINFKDFRPVLMTVSLVDSIITNLDTLTVIHFNHTDTSLAMGSKLVSGFKWIEGVGSNWHPNYKDHYKTLSNLGTFGYSVICSYINGRRFFINDTTYCNLYGESPNCKGLNSINSLDKLSLKVYPSPFTNFITIEADKIEETTLYDMLGRVVHHSEVKSTNPALVYFEEELDAGYYLLKVKTKTSILTQKVLKQ
jgi:hypothetical protein